MEGRKKRRGIVLAESTLSQAAHNSVILEEYLQYVCLKARANETSTALGITARLFSRCKSNEDRVLTWLAAATYGEMLTHNLETGLSLLALGALLLLQRGWRYYVKGSSCERWVSTGLQRPASCSHTTSRTGMTGLQGLTDAILMLADPKIGWSSLCGLRYESSP